MSKPKLYLAAPLFNKRERDFNQWLAGELEPLCSVFLPQRDGLLLSELLAGGVSQEVAETQIFERDRQALKDCELLIAVLDGAHIDEGVAFEIGFANARGCICYGLQTDTRRALPSGNNPMIGRALSSIFANPEDMLSYIAEELVQRTRSLISR